MKKGNTHSNDFVSKNEHKNGAIKPNKDTNQNRENESIKPKKHTEENDHTQSTGGKSKYFGNYDYKKSSCNDKSCNCKGNNCNDDDCNCNCHGKA